MIALGGAGGAVSRYLLTGWVQKLTFVKFPVGTLAVNIIGCLLIGFLASALAGPLMVRQEYRVGLLVGLLGGFTTFSSFGFETLELLGEGQWTLAAVNILASNSLGLLAVWAGSRGARALLAA